VHAYVGCALGSTVYHLCTSGDNKQYRAECVIDIDAIPVVGWALPHMPALITDIILSLDDRFLYFRCVHTRAHHPLPAATGCTVTFASMTLAPIRRIHDSSDKCSLVVCWQASKA
jgi:hypothetical protein